MRTRLVLLVLGVAAAVAAIAPAQAANTATPAVDVARPGLSRLQTALESGGNVVGIATFGQTTAPTDLQLGQLSALGLRVASMHHLPVAVVYGTKAQMATAVTSGVVQDVYPNDQLQWLWDTSNATIRADVAQAAHFDGRGVGVAIVDSGIDATHPALADRVTHNMKIVSPEYLELAGVPASATPAEPYFPIPVDSGPYNNTDWSSGHGTHVSGIVAANGNDSAHPDLVGVAPKADLIGYSTGDTALVVTIVAAYDDILEHHKDWNIQVVNNSWGSSFRQFDPNDPVNIATKAVHDAGVVVAFAAGNDTDEATINPYSVAPWVISVGSETTSKQRSDFSSGGLHFDDSAPTALPTDAPDHHQHFVGDAIGLYHPDVTAPGTNIMSAGTPTGAYVGPTEPGGEAEASGTSMATPQVAGAAAVVLQAAHAKRRTLTPDQVRDVLQVTSTAMADGSAFYLSGFGSIDVKAAVDLVSSSSFSASTLSALQAKRNAVVQRARSWSVRSSDIWSFTALPATAGGLDDHTYTVPVTSTTKGIYATVEFPTTPLIGINEFEYDLTITDAAGREVAVTTTSSNAGTGNVLVDLRKVSGGVTYGNWTIDVSGTIGASDPNILLGNTITATVAQLAPQQSTTTGTTFTPSGSMPLYFTGGDATGPGTSPEGCTNDESTPEGGFAAAKPVASACRSGLVGYGANYGAGLPAEFTSAPLTTTTTVGGNASFVLYLVDTAQPAWSPVFASGLTYTIFATTPTGDTIPVASGDTPEYAQVGPTATRGVYTAAVPATTLPAGVTLTVQFQFSGFYTSTMRFLYGGGTFADAGTTLVTGTVM